MSDLSLGIDIGGTFTDIVAYDHASHAELSCKVLTTHDDPARGVMQGLRRLVAQHALDVARVSRVVHATTLFTNALIERKGAVTGLITTEGFRDSLEIGRERKYELYDIHIENPPPLVPRDRRVEVSERTKADGSVLRALDVSQLLSRAEQLVDKRVESVALVFMHAYANAAHEAEAARALNQRFPQLFVS